MKLPRQDSRIDFVGSVNIGARTNRIWRWPMANPIRTFPAPFSTSCMAAYPEVRVYRRDIYDPSKMYRVLMRLPAALLEVNITFDKEVSFLYPKLCILCGTCVYETHDDSVSRFTRTQALSNHVRAVCLKDKTHGKTQITQVSWSPKNIINTFDFRGKEKSLAIQLAQSCHRLLP